jgi:hypothetical protein
MRSNNRLCRRLPTTPLGTPEVGQTEAFEGQGIGHHNEMYKRASRSLIDVHAIETKERVEKMVRDQEEEEERKRSSRVLKVFRRKGNEGAVSQEKESIRSRRVLR